MVVRTTNKVGALAEFSKVVAETDVRILAMSTWVEDTEAVIRLICDDTPRMIEVLRENGYDSQDRDVVLVDATYQPGILHHLTERLASNNIDLLSDSIANSRAAASVLPGLLQHFGMVVWSTEASKRLFPARVGRPRRRAQT